MGSERKGPAGSRCRRNAEAWQLAGVTRIEVEEQNLGTYGISWFVVFKGDEEAHRMNALHVATVSYQQP